METIRVSLSLLTNSRFVSSAEKQFVLCCRLFLSRTDRAALVGRGEANAGVKNMLAGCGWDQRGQTEKGPRF